MDSSPQAVSPLRQRMIDDMRMRKLSVLSRLFRRRFLEQLHQAHRSGRLQFFGEDARLSDARAFAAWLAPLREVEWVVYAKRSFAGPAAVLDSLRTVKAREASSSGHAFAAFSGGNG